jgi:hypothetical protein
MGHTSLFLRYVFNAINRGIFFDQIGNTAKLAAGGSAESLDKFTFTSTEFSEKI